MRFRRQVPWAHRTVDRAEATLPPPASKTSDAPFVATVSGRRLLRDAAIVLATFGIGYVIASAWLSPVPLLTGDHALPRVLELPAGEAQRKLGELGFRVKFEDGRAHPTVPRGAIVWQDPPAGTILSPNAVVSLAPSAGPQLVLVPDIVGLPTPFALKVLAAAGLKPGGVDTVASDPEPNVIVATRPAAGVGREPGSPVDLVVSGQPQLRRSQTARIVQPPFSTGARR